MATSPKKPKVIAADETFELTYIALMLLLLCFMVILVSLAQLEGNRFRKAIGSVKGALAMLSDAPATSMVQDKGRGMLPHRGAELTEEERAEVIAALEEVLESESGHTLADLIEVVDTDSVVTMTLGDLVLFRRGTATLAPRSSPMLDAISEFLSIWDGAVKVVGHTCDLPIRTSDFPSNWELSVARAVRVVEYLDRNGINGNRMAALGSADSQPVVPNDSEQNRARNRRVEIILESDSWATPANLEIEG